MAATTREREEFAHIMGREGMPLDVVRDVRRLAASYQALMERACNEPMDEGAYERKRLRLEERIQRALAALGRTSSASIQDGWCAIFQGDPRGATVKIRVPSGYTNDWGQEGVCVPA